MAGMMADDSLNNECTSLDHIGTTCIQDLPVEIQVVILKMCPPTEYEKIVQVCRLWKKIVHSSIGVAVRVGGSIVANITPNPMDLDLDEDGIPNLAPKPFPVKVDAQRLAQIGILDCKFEDVRNVTIPPFKYPYLLRNLKFKNYISLTNFSRIMEQEYRKLTKLSISQKALCTLELNMVSMKLPALKKLRVTGTTQQQRDRHYHPPDAANSSILLKNFMTLMDKDFRSIRSFKAQIPAIFHKDATVLISILNFFARHKQTLQILSIKYDEGHDLRPKDRTRPRRNQGPAADPNTVQEAFNFDTLKNNILEKLCFDFNRHATHHMIILLNGIQNMVSSCSNLRILKFFRGLHISPELNSWALPPTLESLKLGLKRGAAPAVPNQNWEFNLDILRNCTVLKKLKLSFTTRRTRVVNGTSLPKSLELIDIRQFKVATNDCTYIVTELPKLRKLTFRNIGQVDGCGFDHQILFDSVLARQFQKVYVYRGFTPGHVPLIIPPENPAAVELHRFFSGALTSRALRIGWIAEIAAYRLIRVTLFLDLDDEDMDMEMEGDAFDDDDADLGDEDDLDGPNDDAAVDEDDDLDLPNDEDADINNLDAPNDGAAEEDDLDLPNDEDIDDPNGEDVDVDENDLEDTNEDAIVGEDDLNDPNDEDGNEDDANLPDDDEFPIDYGGDGNGDQLNILEDAEVPIDGGAFVGSAIDPDPDKGMGDMDS